MRAALPSLASPLTVPAPAQVTHLAIAFGDGAAAPPLSLLLIVEVVVVPPFACC